MNFSPLLYDAIIVGAAFTVYWVLTAKVPELKKYAPRFYKLFKMDEEVKELKDLIK